MEFVSEQKKILITGGAGYIGAHTAVALHEAGYTPIVIDNYSNSHVDVLSRLQQLLGNPVHAYRLDCCDMQAFEQVFSEHPELDGVIHFAAFKAVGESVQKPLKYYYNNLLSLHHVLELCHKYRVKQLVFSSSCTVYGQPAQLPVTESSPVLKAESPYGNTKQISEEMIADFLLSGVDMCAVALRYFNPIGAHPSGLLGELPLGTPNNLVPYITQTAAGWRPFLTIYGNDYPTPDGTAIRDYIHVCDLADAHVQALKLLEEENKPGTCYTVNVGTGKGHSVLEAVHAFESANRVSFDYRFGPRRPGDVVQIYADVSLGQQLLKWKAKYTLLDSMAHAWNWQKTLKKP